LKEGKERELKAIRSLRVLQTLKAHRKNLALLADLRISTQGVGSKSQGLSLGEDLRKERSKLSPADRNNRPWQTQGKAAVVKLYRLAQELARRSQKALRRLSEGLQ
jgi:hypothetical protein